MADVAFWGFLAVCVICWTVWRMYVLRLEYEQISEDEEKQA